jgi:hypothetical protein
MMCWMCKACASSTASWPVAPLRSTQLPCSSFCAWSFCMQGGSHFCLCRRLHDPTCFAWAGAVPPLTVWRYMVEQYNHGHYKQKHTRHWTHRQPAAVRWQVMADVLAIPTTRCGGVLRGV